MILNKDYRIWLMKVALATLALTVRDRNAEPLKRAAIVAPFEGR